MFHDHDMGQAVAAMIRWREACVALAATGAIIGYEPLVFGGLRFEISPCPGQPNSKYQSVSEYADDEDEAPF